ncbi:hypothetical protein Tco_1423093 [Tanacetum coccineum]
MDLRQARTKLEVYSGEAGSSKDAPGPEEGRTKGSKHSWTALNEAHILRGCLRCSGYQPLRQNPELAKKLNDKIPKTVDEMFKRVRAFIRGEVAASTTEVTRDPQWDKGSSRMGWSIGHERSEAEVTKESLTNII